MAAFVPCPRCNRHVKSTESACVFCGAARIAPGATLLSVASLAAIALAACDPKPEVPTTPSVEVPSAAPSGSAPEVVPSASAAAPSSASAPPVASVPPLQPGTGTPQEPPVRPAMRYGIAPNMKKP